MIIVRYDEIGLKSRFVRKKFEDTLINNIRRVLSREFRIKAKIKRDYGRIYVISNEEMIAKRISKVFGVIRAEMVEKMELDLSKNAIEIATKWKEKVKGRSFAVRVRRVGNHDFTSMDAARTIGQRVKEVARARVDLKNPDVEINVEIRDNYTYMVTKSFSGYGGLPTGTQDRVLSILCGKSSMLSTWFALKRGCDVDLMGDIGDEKEVLEFWASYRKINVVPSEGDLNEMLEEAYNLDYKGIYCSITAEELDDFYETLSKRTKPVYMPLLPFSDEEIYEMIKKMIDGAKLGCDHA
ncbi:hypothetical protein DRP07_02300 [Archaeoglobales archaeon]|nr:MAG: hypothetical protein DRP07_02300 [Archaeoglobales archaeon]